MIWLLRFLYQLALSLWLGETLFLSFVVAPVLFTQLPVAQAGQVMSLLFPFYYGVACACGVVIAACGIQLWRKQRRRATFWAAGSGVALLMLAASLYAAGFIQPRLHELRPQREAGDVAAIQEFDRLHHLSVQLNGGVAIGNLLILALVVQGRAWRWETPDDDTSRGGE